ncbi:MAG: hypothetical protein ACLPSF_09685 [Methylocella sp.]
MTIVEGGEAIKNAPLGDEDGAGIESDLRPSEIMAAFIVAEAVLRVGWDIHRKLPFSRSKMITLIASRSFRASRRPRDIFVNEPFKLTNAVQSVAPGAGRRDAGV